MFIAGFAAAAYPAPPVHTVNQIPIRGKVHAPERRLGN